MAVLAAIVSGAACGLTRQKERFGPGLTPRERERERKIKEKTIINFINTSEHFFSPSLLACFYTFPAKLASVAAMAVASTWRRQRMGRKLKDIAR